MRDAHHGTAVVLEMLGTAASRERLVRAVRLVRIAGRETVLRPCSDWRDLSVALGADDTVAVIDPYWGGVLRIHELTELAALGVTRSVMLLGDFRSVGLATDVRQLVRLGFEVIRTAGADDQPYKLAEDLLELFAGGSRLAAEVRAVEHLLTPQRAIVLRWAMRRGRHRLRLEDAARELGVSPRTVRRWCRGSSGPTAGQTLQWARILHASLEISRRPSASAGQTVQGLHFSSYSDFCRRYRRLVGVSVADLPRKRLHEEAVAALRVAVGSPEEASTA